jgi:GMP synthase (glutamine-hydrolysing)
MMSVLYASHRAVESTDGMTADWVHLPYDLDECSNDIINKGVEWSMTLAQNQATIEWE